MSSSSDVPLADLREAILDSSSSSSSSDDNKKKSHKRKRESSDSSSDDNSSSSSSSDSSEDSQSKKRKKRSHKKSKKYKTLLKVLRKKMRKAKSKKSKQEKSPQSVFGSRLGERVCKKMLRAIKKNQFVDLASLLNNRSSNAKELNFAEWEEAFDIFAVCYNQAHKKRYKKNVT